MTAWTERRMRQGFSWVVVGGALLLPVAACGTQQEAVDHCAERCDCEDCSEADLEECEIHYQANIDIAAEFDCEDEYLKYLDCRTNKSKCEDDGVNDPYFAQECVTVGIDYVCPCDNKEEDWKDCRAKASKADNEIIDW